MVCTTGLVADLVHTVGGQYVAPQQLIRAEVDPHLYRVSAGDMSALNRAHIIFYSGLRLEAKMIDLLAQFSGKKPTYAVTQYLDGSKLLKSADGVPDPHVWFDVLLWRSAIDVVRDALAIYDPAHADEYRSRTADYDQQLQRLNSDLERQLAGIPSQHKQLVTAHDAFRYFGRAYQFEVRGVAGISTANAAGLGDIDALIGFIADQKIKAVFTESGVPDRDLLALIEGCRAKNQTVAIAGQLYSDSLGPPEYPRRQLRRHDRTEQPHHRSGVEVIWLGKTVDASRQENRPMAPLLDLHDVTVAFDRRPVLWDIDYVLNEPHLVGIVGPNGAGEKHVAQRDSGPGAAHQRHD